MRVKLVAITTTLVVALLSTACATPDETSPAGMAPSGATAYRTDQMGTSTKFGYEEAPDTRTKTQRKRAKGGYYEEYDYQYERYGFGYHSDHCGDLLACYRLEGRGY